MLVGLMVMALQAATPEAAAPPFKPAKVAIHIPDIPPPMTNGIYIGGGCEGEGCYDLGLMQWTLKAAVYSRPARDAKRIGWIKPGEWAEGLSSQKHFVPRRGVVRDPQRQSDVLAKGDVVYYVFYEGEGFGELWRSGQYVYWGEPDVAPQDAVIEWDPIPPDRPEPVYWLEVKLANGRKGWVNGSDGVRCMGWNRDDDCPPVQ